MKLILASGSKNRQEILTLAKIPFTAIPSDIDEKAIVHQDIRKRVIMVAKAKVEKITQKHQGLIFGADGVNIVGGKVFEKPKSKLEAIKMLKAQSNEWNTFLTGYYILNTKTGKVYQGTSETEYKFRKLSSQEINQYVNEEPVHTWAAAFSPANSMGIRFIESVTGPFATFTHSVPFEKIIPILQKERLIG